MRQRLILITGAPATGKTSLAQRLAQRLDCPARGKDEFKEILFDTLGTGDAAWSRRLSEASFALLFDWAGHLTPEPPLLLLEGNFRVGEHERALSKLILTRSPLQILCEVSREVRQQRLRGRAEQHLRHPGHRDADGSTPADPHCAFLQLAGPKLHFEGNAGEEAYQRLCRKLDQWTSTSSTSV